jgi:hypothetical protein
MFSAHAQAPQALGEGFDKQSPAEIEKANREIRDLFKDAVQPSMITRALTRSILKKYQHLDPKREVPTALLEKAVTYYDQNLSKFPNQAYITIIDYKKRSNLQRFFVINMASGAVEKFRTTHGLYSDEDDNGYAESYGNVIGSGKSSLGFVRTAEIYWGKFDRSVRLDGLSTTNSNLRERAVVLHGWDDAHEANIKQGLSWGCPALDWSVKDGVIDKVANGSLMMMAVSQ